MVLVFSWVVLSFVAAAFGADRKIGFFGTLLLSFFLSPLIGFIGVALSERANAPAESITKYLTSADHLIRNNDFDRAIANLNRFLAINPNPISHYKLAVCYAQKNQEKNSLFHLSKAVELGFQDFNRMENDPYLSWLRHRSGYQEFKENGYKEQPVNITGRDSVSQLKDLADLLEKRLITEEEFQEQKRKILNT